jgi:hypothetical protein
MMHTAQYVFHFAMALLLRNEFVGGSYAPGMPVEVDLPL